MTLSVPPQKINGQSTPDLKSSLEVAVDNKKRASSFTRLTMRHRESSLESVKSNRTERLIRGSIDRTQSSDTFPSNKTGMIHA